MHNFFIPYVFEVKESIHWCFSKQICPIDLENPGQLPVLQVLKGTDDCVLSILVISSLYVFEVMKSISAVFSKLLHLNDLENSGQLPVSEVLEDTDDWVLRFFVISPFLTFLGSRNSFLDVSRSYHVRVTPKI